MKYLVTGAAGFIGSHIVDVLLARGHKVTGYDNLSTGNLNFLSKALNHENFDLIKADILDAQQLKLAFEDVDAVYHLAANADIRGGLHDPYRDLEQNTYGTFRVLEAMR